MKKIGINFRAVVSSKKIVTFYRMGDSTIITSGEGEYLYSKLGIRYCLDLRSSSEIQHYGSPHGLIAGGINWVHAPFTGYSSHAIDGRSPRAEDYIIYYMDMYKHAAPCLPYIFRNIAQFGQRAFIISCHFGKDRTGLIVAALMSILDCPFDEIVQDYVATASSLIPHIDHFREKWSKRNHTKEDYLSRLNTHKETMQTVLKQVNQSYGSVEAMLLNAGVSSTDIAQIRSNLSICC